MALKTNTELLRALIQEHTALFDKMRKLDVTLKDPENRLIVGSEQWGLLSIQLKVMETYAEVLFQRIQLIEQEEK